MTETAAAIRAEPDPTRTTAIDWYDRCGHEVADGYEQLDPDRLYAWAADLMAALNGTAADIGAGTGRDAAWLAGRGYRTTAVEPSATMRRIGRARHREAPIRWLDDRLPTLRRARELGPFDLVVANAVWMHIAPPERREALQAILAATRPGGLVLMSLRHGSAPPERRMHPCGAAEISELAGAHGAAAVRTIEGRLAGLARQVDLPTRRGAERIETPWFRVRHRSGLRSTSPRGGERIETPASD